MVKMRPPCEVVVNEILPTIRATLVRDLILRHKLSQVEVAKRLGITQPAVSQYMSALRGKGRERKNLSKVEFARILRKLSDEVAQGKLNHSQITRRYCAICKLMLKEEIFRVVRKRGTI